MLKVDLSLSLSLCLTLSHTHKHTNTHTGSWTDFVGWVSRSKAPSGSSSSSSRAPRAAVLPPSDQQQLASRRAAQQFWSSTTPWEKVPPAVQEEAQRVFGIKVSWSLAVGVCVCPERSLQKLQLKYLKKYSIHMVKTEVRECEW